MVWRCWLFSGDTAAPFAPADSHAAPQQGIGLDSRANIPALGASGPKPAVLLARPAFAGTLAAARDLGVEGIAVTVLSAGVLDCARWSRFVSGHIGFSGRFEPEALFAALMRAGPGLGQPVLLPVCDISAWTYAAHAAELARHYRLYAPGLETLNRLLDKTAIEAAFARAGIGLLQSWLVQGEAELEALRAELAYPLIVKPRAHVGRSRNDKGLVVADYPELLTAIREIATREAVFCEDGEGAQVHGYFFQRFVARSERGVLSVSGFIDSRAEHFVARAARKVMLRTEPAGVCLEPKRMLRRYVPSAIGFLRAALADLRAARPRQGAPR